MRKPPPVLMMVAMCVAVGLAAVTWHAGPTFEVTAAGPSTWHASGDGSSFGNLPAVATITFAGTVGIRARIKGAISPRDKLPERQLARRRPNH